MTTDLPDTHSTPTTTEPLWLRLSEGLGPLPELALQAVAEKIADQCAVWYGIGARDVEAVLSEAARHGLVHGARAVAADRADLCAELDRLRQVQRSLSDKLATERERCAAWLEREGRHDMAYGLRHAMHCGPNVEVTGLRRKEER